MPGDGKDAYILNSYIMSGKVKWLKKTLENSLGISFKVNIYLLNDAGIYPSVH